MREDDKQEKSLARKAFETIVLTFISTMTLAFFSAIGFIALQVFEIKGDISEMKRSDTELIKSLNKTTETLVDVIVDTKVEVKKLEDPKNKKPEQKDKVEIRNDIQKMLPMQMEQRSLEY